MVMETIAKMVQVITVVVGVVISVLSFNATREKEAEARRIEASKPFLEIRQKLYMEAVKSAAVLANREGYSKQEIASAKRRFRELYVAELSMVESPEVEKRMVDLASKTDPSLNLLNPAQKAAYDLSHALRDSFVVSWGANPK
jgi:hypothetical protein